VESSAAILILAVAMAVVAGVSIALTINDRSASARSRRQAETQRNLNAASVQLLRMLHDLDILLDDLKRRIVPERRLDRDRDDG
jgi:hypothetical protein